jgi:hypothetical protein
VPLMVRSHPQARAGEGRNYLVTAGMKAIIPDKAAPRAGLPPQKWSSLMYGFRAEWRTKENEQEEAHG